MPTPDSIEATLSLRCTAEIRVLRGFRNFRRPDQEAQRRSSGTDNVDDQPSLETVGTALRSVRPALNPLSHLADGLVKSLAKIDADSVSPDILESYFTAVENRVADIQEFEIPLRLFRYGIRYGIRYLISENESEFVELIKPERVILSIAFWKPVFAATSQRKPLLCLQKFQGSIDCP